MRINFSELAALVSPDGQRQLIEFIHKAQAERGAGWLESITAEYPTFAWIAELVATRTADEAIAELQSQFPIAPLSIFKPQLRELHSVLRAEIDKPRG